MASLHRQGDAVLTVRQNNETRLIEVIALNEVAEKTLGYSAKDISGTPLTSLLPPKIVDTLKDYVEFGDSENDLAAVLRRVRNFSIKKRDGSVEPYKLKIIRTDAKDRHSWFQLIMRNEAAQRREEGLRAALLETFKGHEVLDSITGLPDAASLKKDIELTAYHVSNQQLDACFAIMEVDNYNDLLGKHGRISCNKILKEMAVLAKQKLRSDDVVGAASYNALGLILMDVSPDVAHLVLNRLRWAIASHPFAISEKAYVTITVSISFARIGSDGKKDLLAACQQTLQSLHGKSSNAVHETLS